MLVNSSSSPAVSALEFLGKLRLVTVELGFAAPIR